MSAIIPAINVLLFFVIYGFTAVSDALAYIDPGTGSFMIQIALGFILAGLFTLKMYWLKLRTFITQKLHNMKTTTKQANSSNGDSKAERTE